MKHHLIVGTWTPPGAVFVLVFDDETHSLELLKRIEIPQDQPISWLTFDHARKNIYGGSLKKWSSYSIKSPGDIKHLTSFPIGGHPRANDVDTRTRAIFLLAAKKPPYNVYACPFYEHAGFLNVFRVDPATGALAENIQNTPLDEISSVHGMAFDSAEEYLYSADLWSNKLWCHKKDPQTGQLSLVGSISAPDPDDHPRWVELHPRDKYLYALMEKNNRVCIYVIDPVTHMPVYTHTSYPLLPPDFLAFHPGQYRGDVVFTSASGRYLFASTRSNKPGVLTGYLTALALGPEGNVERQICLLPTPTSGGHSNAVSPCPWSDEWLALCDDERGFVEMYRWKDEVLGRVAHLDVREPGFGMNAIWYD